MKKVFLVLFSLIMMCSVSFGIEENVEYESAAMGGGAASYKSKILFDTYTGSIINKTIRNYHSDSANESYISAFDSMMDSLRDSGIKYVLGKRDGYLNLYLLDNSYESELCYYNGKIMVFLENDFSNYTDVATVHSSAYSDGGCYIIKLNSSAVMSRASSNSLLITELIEANTSIYNLTNINNNKYYWDGASYFYKYESSDTNTTNYTDEQIAEIVERFINSNAYLEKAYYNGDYFITYDKLTGYFRGYSYSWNIDLAIEYGNYNEEGEFVATGTKEGEAWRIRPYEFSGDIFVKFGDWLASKFNTYSFEYFSISSDSTIEPRYIGSLEHNYCSNYKENEVVIYSSKQIRYVGEETNSEGKTETIVTDNYIPPTVLKDSVTGEQIVIRDNLKESSDSLETIITPNADFSGLKQAFEKYISFIDISSITWLTTAISSMITIFVPFVALGIIIFLINRILNGGS